MRSAKWILVATVAFAVAGAAVAQPPGGGRGGNRGGNRGGATQPGQGRGMMAGGGGGVAGLLTNEGVQKELKLSDEQKAKIKEFGEEQTKKMREAFGDGGRPDQEKMAELRKAATEAAEKFVKNTLNADQQKRIKQINTQQMGLRAFSNEEVAKALKLTDEQKEKIKGLGEEMNKDLQELRGGGFNAESMQKMATIRKEYLAKAADSLTGDQKTAWKSLVGEPFELQMGGRGAGGQGGTGGGRGGNRPPRGGTGGNPPPM